jgi:superfamily II DNA or RNA helicase
VDVKPTEHAVFVASSTENREFIQRRGRVLRHSPGKECAYIYDILVVPPKDKFGKYFSDGENLVNPELKRFNVFHSDCENKTEALKRIEPLLNSYSSETN